MRIVAIDCEMGGLQKEASLLTAYFGVYNFDESRSTFEFKDELYLRIRPDEDDGLYMVTATGLKVNGIEIGKHHDKATKHKECKTLLYNFLWSWSGGGVEKLIPVGHGVRLDIDRLVSDKLISQGSMDNLVSYRCLDTSSIAQFFKLCGKLPDSVSGSLESLIKHLDIDMLESRFHEADFDAMCSVRVLEAMIKKYHEGRIY